MTSHRTHRVNNVLLHCAEAGPADGPLVILLHGFPEFWWGWRNQIDQLASAGFRVVAPDQRGDNLSEKPKELSAYHIDVLVADVVALANHLGSPQFFLVGHDWGGIIAWRVAATFPDAVRRLVVLNAPHLSAWQRLTLWQRARQLMHSYYIALFQPSWMPERVLRLRRFALLRRCLVTTSRAGTFSEADLTRYVQAWSQPRAMTGMLNYYRALRLKRSPLRSVIKPETLLIWGKADAFLDVALAHASISFCPRGELNLLKGLTHWLHLEKPAVVNEAMIQFFERADRA